MPKKIDSKTKAAVVAALAAGESPGSVARRFGVSRSYASQVRAEVKKARRCPTCGAALASTKCLACWLRTAPERRAPFASAGFFVRREPEEI
ncbi:MAG: hypothetical protein IIW01_05485 [Thermoguttaceae bacterium]|nr:hypothetical protein [Thermoguttaceae bacterium]